MTLIEEIEEAVCNGYYSRGMEDPVEDIRYLLDTVANLREALSLNKEAQNVYYEASKEIEKLQSALSVARNAALEEAVKICRESVDTYGGLLVRARKAGDTQSALAHFCEKEASAQLARDISALKSPAGPGRESK